jgi:hypothetical protein
MNSETTVLNDTPVMEMRSESTLPQAAKPAEVVADAPSDPEQGTTTEDQANSGSKDDAPATETKPAKKPWFQERIDKLTFEKHQREREAEKLRAELAAVKESQPLSKDRPKLEDFDFDQEAYTEAVSTWVLRKSEESKQEEVRKAQEAAAVEERQSHFQEKLAAFEEVSPGAWHKAITADMPTPPELIELVQEHDAGLQLATYLADNLEEARAIARFSPAVRAAKYIILADRLNGGESVQAAKPLPPKPQPTRAPPPVPTLKPKAAVQVPPEMETSEQRIARWRAEGKFKKSLF